jgi:glutamate dehydrogenase (NADP+)
LDHTFHHIKSSSVPSLVLIITHTPFYLSIYLSSSYSVLGPFKGGLRFHPDVDEGILKFLGFEQMFKNALTGLPMGGGKGGSDFNPKGKSETEIRRFCVAFMTELFRYLHPSTDVPAGDIGVGGRELGYMYGQYKRLSNRHGEGVLTGKSLGFGGSPLRPEATGYGLVYMAQLAVEKRLGKSLKGMRCAVSGSGNVAQYASEKLLELEAKVLTVSDSNGVLVFEDGMTPEDLKIVMECKNVKRGRLLDLDGQVSGKYVDKQSPWTMDIKYDLALPCATQNEIDEAGAKLLVKNGVVGVLEGANLPTNMQAQDVLRAKGVLYIPGKASNAGGVGVSGLEMSQNAQRLTWKTEEVDAKLQAMIASIYSKMESSEGSTLEEGANRAGFIKVATAMRELGWVQ